MRAGAGNGRGFTLLEVMVAMAVMLVALLGLAKLQVIGIQSNQGARAQGQAIALARELASGLERLDYSDPLLAEASGTAGSTPPPGFGSLLFDASHATTWADANAIPGVTLDAALEKDPGGAPVYQRRWTVWNIQDASVDAVKLIAVSVLFHERGNQRPREALVYVTRTNGQNVLGNSQAFR